ncbi:hypothetical protein [Pseudarthrobacter sp. N5]|uniref:hypothetical protein n=1 Tax=Pseudarthrobacter sp. N5 TaxID=3418416 RepID=UPI003CF9D80C
MVPVSHKICAGRCSQIDEPLVFAKKHQQAPQDRHVMLQESVRSIGVLPGCLKEILVDEADTAHVAVLWNEERSAIGDI